MCHGACRGVFAKYTASIIEGGDKMTIILCFLVLIVLGLVCLSIPVLSVIGVALLLIGILSPIVIVIRVISTAFNHPKKEKD